MTRYKWLGYALSMALSVVAYADDDIDFSPVNPWTQGCYFGPIDVAIKGPMQMQVRIETQDLILHSITEEQFEDYSLLFGDAEAIEKYADGIPWTSEEVEQTMSMWIARWESGDPFSAFAVYLKNETKQFIGHIVLGHGLYQGQAELAFLFKPQYLKEGFAQQAVTAILFGYASQLIKEGHLVNLNSEYCEPAPLSDIHSVVRRDNPYCVQALRRSGMKHGSLETIWGYRRVHYSIEKDELLSHQTSRETYIPEEN